MVQLSVDHICVESMNDSQLDGHQQMTNLLNVVVDDESDSDLNGIPDYVLNLSDEDDESSDNSLHSTSPVTLRMKDKRHRSTRPMGIIDKFNTDHFPESTKLLPLSPESPVITRLKNYISSTRIGQNMRNKRHCIYFTENPLKSAGFTYLDDCPHISTPASMPL